ncbi:MAG: GDP-mannose 4,6-dehydratase [Myxococcales bacterium]|nr:GDP-mannose 4,6-dehydratase [Myxococcales bacterium]
MARVLITGAGGFVGRHLARLLSAEGHEVQGLCAHFEDAPAVAEALGRPRERVVACDITRPDDVLAAFASDPPEAVVHLAGLTFVPEANRRPGLALEVNAVGTRNLLEAARVHAPGARFVYVSTSDVYGDLRPEDLPIHEGTPVHPLNAYSISKAGAELFCYQYARV